LLWEEGHQDFEVEAVTIVSPNLLTFHRVVARFGLRLRGCPIPSLEVSERFLDVAARKLSDNALADAYGSIPPIFAKSGSNLMV